MNTEKMIALIKAIDDMGFVLEAFGADSDGIEITLKSPVQEKGGENK
jgi:hypothetical protein